MKIIKCFKSLLSILPKQELHIIYCDNGPKDFKIGLLMDSLIEIGTTNFFFFDMYFFLYLIFLENEFGCQLIWNFFAENHGGSACDADGNIARNFLKDYVLNEKTSLKNDNSKIITLINQIKNQQGHNIPNNCKYDHIQQNLFQGIIFLSYSSLSIYAYDKVLNLNTVFVFKMV